MNVSRRALYAIGGAVVLALAVAGVVRFVFDDDDDTKAVGPTASLSEVNPSSGPSAAAPASAAAQQEANEATVASWTADELRDALGVGAEKPGGPGEGSPDPVPEPQANGGDVADQDADSPAASTPSDMTKAATAACKQPTFEKPAGGYPYKRGCWPANLLRQVPSKQVGRLITLPIVDGNRSYRSLCSGTVVNTALGASDPGNGAVVVTAGHCLGDAGSVKQKRPWKSVPQPMFVPQPKVRKLHQLLDNQSVSDAQVQQWLLKNAWFAQTNAEGNWVGYAPPQWMQDGAYDLDFGTIVFAPRNGKTIQQALGGVGLATSYTTPKEVLSIGYPSAAPFNGRTLFACLGPVKVGDTFVSEGETKVYVNELGVGCDMTGGSSGGPWFSTAKSDKGWQIISVNSYGPPNIMFGPYLNGNHWQIFGFARAYGTPQ